MRVDAYSKGKKFDGVKFLNNYKKSLDKNKKSKKSKPRVEKINIEEDSDEDIEDDSDEDEEDSDYVPTYLKDKTKSFDKEGLSMA